MLSNDANIEIYAHGTLYNSQTKNNQTGNGSNRTTKQVGTRKQIKTSKQEEMKSKLAVAEAHIASLDNTIIENNSVIRTRN